jgi:tRNA modification GTPase
MPPVDAAAVDRLITEVEQLQRRGAEGRVLKEGLTIAIVGRPNVGKSTLLNALLNEARAIVTSVPGTTRDTVEEEAVFAGVPVRLIDTAGLRGARDAIEAEGVARAESAIARADLVLLVLDRSIPLTEDDRRLTNRAWDRPVVLAWNKSDLPRGAATISGVGWLATHEISAIDGSGIDELREATLRHVLRGNVPQRGTALLLDRWETDLLRRVQQALVAARDLLARSETVDKVAEELRCAHHESGRLLGIDLDESMLDRLFAQFCVGK